MTINDQICINTDISRLLLLIGLFINIIKILVPIILIFIGTKDYFQATISNDETAIINTTKNFKNKLIAGISIFFIPTIISFALTLINTTKEYDNTLLKCTNCMLNKKECKENVTLLL